MNLLRPYTSVFMPNVKTTFVEVLDAKMMFALCDTLMGYKPSCNRVTTVG